MGRSSIAPSLGGCGQTPLRPPLLPAAAAAAAPPTAPLLHCHAAPPAPQGAADSMDFRIFFKQQKDGAVVSPWHDIPLYAGACLAAAPATC